MRNGVLGAMGEIVQRVLTKDELDDNAKNLRDQFLDRLEVWSSPIENSHDNSPGSKCLEAPGLEHESA